MKLTGMLAGHAAVLFFVGSHCGSLAVAGPIGADNYDFARFSRPVAWSIAGESSGWSYELVDVNGDRRADQALHAMDAGNWRVQVALSAGDGTFSMPIHWTYSGDWIGWATSFSDVDGDGRSDLVAHANDARSWRTSIALSLGNGSFGPPVAWEASGDFSGWTFTLADVNADGKKDLILQAADGTNWRSIVAMGHGDGTFASAVKWSAPGHFGGWNPATGDFNGDGRVDLLLDYHGTDGWRAWVALSTGAGTFTSPTPWAIERNLGHWSSSRADFNADGRTDLQLWIDDGSELRSLIAFADGEASFLEPVEWKAASLGADWVHRRADFNGDGGADMLAQRADSRGWDVLVAISLGNGAFVEPKAWGVLDGSFLGWRPTLADVTGDGRADLMVHALHGTTWDVQGAFARGCDTVIGSNDDYVGLIAQLPSMATEQIVCFRPGLYEREIVIGNKNNISFVAPQGGVTLQTHSNPGAPVLIWQSRQIEVDGFTIRNLFSYELRSDGDQTGMVSRAIAIMSSSDVTVSHSILIGSGKQVTHVRDTSRAVLAASRVECYYFCVDSRRSSFAALRSHFVANHRQLPLDDHAMIWSFESDQFYFNSTMEFLTGRSLLAGVNNFEVNRIEIDGETIVSENAQAWVSQHPNYNGFNVRIRGTYPVLADWYFVAGAGWQQRSQICYEPGVGKRHCVQRGASQCKPSYSGRVLYKPTSVDCTPAAYAKNMPKKFRRNYSTNGARIQ